MCTGLSFNCLILFCASACRLYSDALETLRYRFIAMVWKLNYLYRGVVIYFSVRALTSEWPDYLVVLLFGTLLWLAGILLLRYILKGLLYYHGWMYEGRGKISLRTKAWVVSPHRHQ